MAMTKDTQTVGDVPLDKLTSVYLKIRAKKSELAAKFKDEDKKLTDAMDLIKSQLLAYCKDQNVESVRTEAGLVYRTVKKRYWTSDWESMHKFILENESPEFLEKRLNQTAVKEFLEDNPEAVPPGLNIDSEYVISVRKP